MICRTHYIMSPYTNSRLNANCRKLMNGWMIDGWMDGWIDGWNIFLRAALYSGYFDPTRQLANYSNVPLGPWWRHQMEKKFRVIALLWGKSIGYRWIPRTKVSDAELWCFLWSVPEPTVEQPMGDLGRHRTHCDVIVMAHRYIPVANHWEMFHTACEFFPPTTQVLLLRTQQCRRCFVRAVIAAK